MMMKHAVIAAGAAALLTAGLGTAQASSLKLTVVHGSPEGHVISRQLVEPWMACVREESGGQVDFDYYPGGQISSTPELFRALHSGIADVTPVPVGYVSDEMPLSGISMLPGLGATSESIVRAYSDAVKNGVLRDELANNDMIALAVMAFPPYQVISMGDRIDSVADFRGKVLRSAGGAMNIAINELGASPAEIAIGDTYIALERGTADGTISAFASVKPFNLHEIMRSMSKNGSFGTFSNILSMRLGDFEALPEETQQLFADCGSRTEIAMAQFLDGQVDGLIQEFSDLGIDVYEFSESDLAEINERLARVQDNWVQRLARRGLPAQRVLDEYRAALDAN